MLACTVYCTTVLLLLLLLLLLQLHVFTYLERTACCYAMYSLTSASTIYNLRNQRRLSLLQQLYADGLSSSCYNISGHSLFDDIDRRNSVPV
jgi:hypothetical protein